MWFNPGPLRMISKRWPCCRFTLSEPNNVSEQVLPRQLPLRLIDGVMPCSLSTSLKSLLASSTLRTGLRRWGRTLSRSIVTRANSARLRQFSIYLVVIRGLLLVRFSVPVRCSRLSCPESVQPFPDCESVPDSGPIQRATPPLY